MSLERSELYEFGDFRVNVGEHIFERSDGRSCGSLPEKAFQTLVYLVRNHGHLITKKELLDEIWPDSFVEQNNLDKSIHAIRHVLGETPGAQTYIETVRKHGYRFVADVKRVADGGPSSPSSGDPPGSTDRHAGMPSARATESGHHVIVDLAEWRNLEGHAETQTEQTTASYRQDVKQIRVDSPAWPLAEPKHRTPIVLFSVGFLSAIFLIVLLSFNLDPASSTDPNDVKSIAVLPVKPLTAENHDSMYEFGITDSLINKLRSANGLVVRPLSATRQYSGNEQNAIAAGREQKVDYVLASNYQIADGKIRITSQLINVASGQVEEVFTDERPTWASFSALDAVVANIGEALLRKFDRSPNSLLAKRYTTNEEAYRLYLQGAALADKRTQEEVRKAIEYFEQAILLDPNYALAYARLANAHTAVVGNRSGGADEQYPKAKAAIEKALSIDDDLAEAHSFFGEIKSDFEGDFAGAEREHKHAIALNPNSSVAHRMYSLMLTSLGRHDESIAEIKTAVDLEPASVLNHLVFGRSLFFARRYHEAIAELKQTAETDPEYFFAHQSLSIAYRLKGEPDRAFESFLKTRTREGTDEINLWKTIYAKSGWRGILARQLEQAKVDEKNGKPNYSLLANLSSELNENEQAFAYLEKAIAQNGTISLLKVHPRFDGLRGDPRFDELLRRVGLK